MKIYLFIVVMSLCFFKQSFASSFVSCDLVAKVNSIQSLGVLDDTVTFSRIDQSDSYRYIAKIEITSSQKIYGQDECPRLGEELIELKNSSQVKVGEIIKIGYSSHGDRGGYSVTYKIK